MPDVRSFLRRRTFMFALALTIALLIANVIALPRFGNPTTWADTLTIFAPFALVAMASTPALLSGGGGLDLSVGPLANLVNIVLVLYLLPSSVFGHPALAIPAALLLGAGVGALNGFAVTVLRYPPVIATLCAFFVIGGIDLVLVTVPVPAPPGWTTDLAGSYGPIPGAVVLIGAPALLWLALQRTAFYRTLLAVGGNDAAAHSAGVNVAAVRIVAYSLGGALAAVAGISLTAFVQTADSTLGSTYTLIALAAVVLGGTPFGGGRGGLLGSTLGAASIFLVQNLLSSLDVSPLWLQVVYGSMLLVGAVVGAQMMAPPRTVATT